MQMVDRFLCGKFWAVAIPQRPIALLVTSVLSGRAIALPICKVILQSAFGSFRYRILCYSEK